MENDSPNLFDSEPVSVNLTVTESNKEVDMINKTNDDDTLNIENINESNPNEEQNESEYHTDEFDEENDSDNHIENQLNNSDKSIDQSIEPQEEHSSKNTTKDVHKGLPYGRVKLIMKMDPDVNIVAGDAVFLVTKATEGFLRLLAQHCHKTMVDSNKKTLQKKHIETVIEENIPFEFLEGALDW